VEDAQRLTLAARTPHRYTRGMADTIYQLKVTLRGIRPPIWRRVRVPGTVTLAQLHSVLQIALGWSNSHLHQFRVGRETFGMPDPDGWGPSTTSERKVRLHELAGLKSKLIYDYDFGDGWEHDVLVERVDAADGSLPLPICLDGRRSRPPEDCGGPYGYANLVEALADPKHPEHQEMREWVGPYWRAEHFDIDFVNKELRTLGARWQRAAAPRRPRSRSATRPAND
jgi:hypothetical protein